MSEKSKFKVGDKVKVIKSNNTDGWFLPNKKPIFGTVTSVNCDDEIDRYYVSIEGHRGIYDNGWFTFRDEHLELVVEQQGVKCDSSESQPIASDGGSSDYYFTQLPKHIIDQIIETGGIEIKDIARYVYDNNADAFNIIKAQKRIIEARKGKGKAGIDLLYDANKIKFFASEQYEAIKQEGSL